MILMYYLGHAAYKNYDLLGPYNKINLYQHGSYIYINNYFSLLLFLLLQISKILGRTTVNIKISEPGLHFLFIKNQ